MFGLPFQSGWVEQLLANFGAARFALDNLIFCESQLGAKFTVPRVTKDRRGDILCAWMDMYAQLSVCVCVYPALTNRVLRCFFAGRFNNAATVHEDITPDHCDAHATCFELLN